MRLEDPDRAETRAKAYLYDRHRNFVTRVDVRETRRSGHTWILKGGIVFKKSRLIEDQRYFTLQLSAKTGEVTHYRLATSAKRPRA